MPQMAAPQVAQGQVAHQLNRRLGIAAVQGRPVKVILIEQADVAQERQLAVLEQVASAPLAIVVAVATEPARRSDRRRRAGAARGR